MLEMILAFILAWICTLSGVALGGFLVFRTKREGYDPLFQANPPTGESFHLDDLGLDAEAPATKTELPKAMQDAQARFSQQFSGADMFAESLAEKAREK